MHIRNLGLLLALAALAACHGQGPDSSVEQWWYTETPQGYTDQGAAVGSSPQAGAGGSTVPVAGGAKGTHQGDRR